MIKYKGYSIEQNFYGKGEYTVQYQGDDVVFNSVEEAKKFINEISDSFNDAKVYASGDKVKAKLPSGHIEEFTVNKDLGSEIEVIEKTNSGKSIKYTIRKSQIVLDGTQVNDEKYLKGVHNRSTLYGQYHNGTIKKVSDSIHDSISKNDLMDLLFNMKFKVFKQGTGKNGSGETIEIYRASNDKKGIQFRVNKNDVEMVVYRDLSGKEASPSTLDEVKKLLKDSVGYVEDSNNYIGNAKIISKSELPKVGETHKFVPSYGKVRKVEKSGSKDGYSIYTVYYAEDGSGDVKFTYAVKDVKDSTMFKVTDKRTGKVRLVRATDSLEAIDKVSNISNLGGKK